MFRQFQNAGLVAPTLLSLVGLVVLIGLGNWQMARKAWKDGLVRQIETRVKSAPIAFGDALAIATKDREEIAYRPVTVTGRFSHDKEMYFYAPDQKKGPGVHVYAPLEYADKQVVWVNRGYVRDPFIARDKRADSVTDEEVTVIGLVRLAPSETSVFTPKSDLPNRRFFWRDLSNMHATAFDKTEIAAAPFFVEVTSDGAPKFENGPEAGVTRLKLSNRHLEYAVTWYGLACTLIGVYLAFAWSRLKASRDPAEA